MNVRQTAKSRAETKGAVKHGRWELAIGEMNYLIGLFSFVFLFLFIFGYCCLFPAMKHRRWAPSLVCFCPDSCFSSFFSSFLFVPGLFVCFWYFVCFWSFCLFLIFCLFLVFLFVSGLLKKLLLRFSFTRPLLVKTEDALLAKSKVRKWIQTKNGNPWTCFVQL